MIFLAAASLVLLLVLRLVYSVFLRTNWSTKSECVDGVMIVIGSGGHTAEMLRLVGRLDGQKFRRRVYLLADSDIPSRSKVVMSEKGRRDYRVCLVPRMRAPLESWVTAIFKAPQAFAASFLEVFNTRPQLLLCNGPGTCVPVAIAALLLNFTGLTNTRIVFVESICRVQTLSLSGRLLYFLLWGHQFLVQWPELALKHPRATYIGQLV